MKERTMLEFLSALRIPLIVLAAAFLASAASAHDYKAGDLRIDHPWIRATPAGARTAGGYAAITNNGKEPDRLIGGSVAGVEIFEIHEMSMDNNVMKMRKLETPVEIKPGETFELKPGGFHLMMIGLKAPFKEGEKIKGTLVFEKAGTVEVEFKVEPAGAKIEHEHGADAHKAH